MPNDPKAHHKMPFKLNRTSAFLALFLVIPGVFWKVRGAEYDVQLPDEDPILQYHPHFARSLPLQILLVGIVTTLLMVLLIHLIFTANYQWSLTPVNYALQLSSLLVLLISLFAMLQVVLSATLAESMRWPFMLSYISISIPPSDYAVNGWSTLGRNSWIIVGAVTSGLIQVTHIEFLTLLFPSRLECKMIFILLGPFAALASVMQLVPIRGNDQQSALASAIRNVCNATLSLLFTSFLLIWGLVISRGRAWRTDGGTAAFGVSAMGLSLLSTGLTILHVRKEEEYLWIPCLMWSVLLWQIFFGWWWWVGAGGGSSVLLANENVVQDALKQAQKRDTIKKGLFGGRNSKRPKSRNGRKSDGLAFLNRCHVRFRTGDSRRRISAVSQPDKPWVGR